MNPRQVAILLNENIHENNGLIFETHDNLRILSELIGVKIVSLVYDMYNKEPGAYMAYPNDEEPKWYLMDMTVNKFRWPRKFYFKLLQNSSVDDLDVWKNNLNVKFIDKDVISVS